MHFSSALLLASASVTAVHAGQTRPFGDNHGLARRAFHSKRHGDAAVEANADAGLEIVCFQLCSFCSILSN